ncbi:hypothetical protein BDV96DRAFT_400737 [Lophiotrema nucula]|uniref:SPX domain-containing protein n=1 Tax=Lophiotrema nucula TaxID=690887 RepID=A0A6A5ZF33_9PLEO|nr:hypothetical protein BDV96DRAFT_400737 [Lophiotrema nucula]
MKYGDTLRQRSIPEWGHYNIDYDYLKDLIKHHTSEGTGKAVSIPGQGETTEKAFGDTFFKILRAQHERINLFIRSKSGEIERRLEYIHNRLIQLQGQRREGPDGRLAARVIEKYAKIDADVTKAGEEIRSLSRFRIAQRTGFHKILKKYKRWTRDRELEHRFKAEVLSSPDSFFQADLGTLLDQYIDVLAALRAPLNDESIPIGGAKNTASRLAKTIEAGTEVDFDVALNTVPLGSQGNRATYWIHPDHIVEVQVLLLQHMRLLTGSTAKSTPRDTPASTPTRRKSSATAFDKYFGCDDAIGVVVLDDISSYARKQNASTIGAIEENTGMLRAKAAGNARWTTSGDAAAVVGLESNLDVSSTESIRTAKLKRKHLASLFDPSLPVVDEEVNDSNTAAQASATKVKRWLTEHQNVKPIAGVCAKRTRFIGLHNTVSGGIWASLDSDIFMKSSLLEDSKSSEWLSEARNGSVGFPHAVLEVRREGSHSATLIHTLDRSHLVERVRGFSLETHAVWTCSKPAAMAAPVWLPLLEQDIRKLPAPVKRQRRKGGSALLDSVSHSPSLQTSGSTTSVVTDGQSSPNASRNGETSATSVAEFIEPPPLRAFRKKRKPYAGRLPAIEAEEEPQQQRYWNEYDNPEDEDEGYYIYIDPNAEVKFPGQELFEGWTRKARQLFRKRRTDEESPLLSSLEDGSSDEETADEATNSTANKSYGTTRSEGYFSGLFRSLRDPYHEANLRRQSELERQSLLTQIQLRQHEREMTKLRLYSLCLTAAVVIDLILGTLTMTTRKRERGVADVAILLGTICSLLLLIAAVSSMRTRREKLGWIHQGTVFLISITVIIVDIALLCWVVNS